MITDLIHKEYKQTLDRESSKWRIALKIIGSIIGLGIFVALESFIFLALDKKINDFAKDSNGTFYFLVLFLTILLGVSVIVSLNKARKVLYQRKDSEILLHLPVVTEEVVISKVVFIYINNVIINFVVSFPLLCCYCATRGFKPPMYVLSALYPVLIGLFTCGITLMLVSVYNHVYKFIKDKPWLQILLGSLLVIALCFAYKYVLELFINLINNAQFDSMFGKGFIDSLAKASKFFIPVFNIADIICQSNNILPNICIFLGSTLLVLVLGFVIVGISYSRFLKREFSENRSGKSSSKVKPMKLETPIKALIKKEFVLLFRNSNYIFSFTSLLIMQPFLAFVVISTLNKLMYGNMEMFLVYFPELINGLNLVLILLFASVIATSAMDVYSREGRALIVSKYIPISPIKQTFIKLIVPVTLSVISLFVTATLLVSFSEISVLIYFISFVMGLILIVSLAISGVYIDLKKLNSTKTSNIEYLSTFLSVFLPLLLFGLHLLMMFYHLSNAILYCVLVGIMILILVPLVLTFKHVVNKNFKEMRIN